MLNNFTMKTPEFEGNEMKIRKIELEKVNKQ
jgi:hypothetical protein